MHVRWTVPAIQDLTGIVKHIQEENPTAARQVARKVIGHLEKLRRFPNLGRPGEVAGTRELVIPPYVIVYRVTAGFVEPLRIGMEARTGEGSSFGDRLR